MTRSADLQPLMTSFMDGTDVSLSAANRLEALLDEMFPGDAYIQDIVGMLAQYRPGGGEFLHETPEVQRKLVRASAYHDGLKLALTNSISSN
jgi:hypothetical protein